MKAICGFFHLDGAPARDDALGALRAALVPGEGRHQPACEGLCEGSLALGAAEWGPQPGSRGEPQLARHGETGCIVVVDARLEDRDALAHSLGLSIAPRPNQAQLILHAWLQWGEQCAERLRGDFAFAAWDPRSQQLFCARDIMGVRPLYVHHAPGRLLAFASRAQALLALTEVPNDLDEGRIADALIGQLEAIDKTSTFYQAIKRLPPAHTLTTDPQRSRPQRYWRLQPGLVSQLPRTDAQWAAALTDVLERAVRNHLDGDVRVGCMLSGGMDSSSLAVIARDQLAAAGKEPLPTFSSIDNDPACPETRAIRTMLELPGFTPTLIAPADIESLREELTAAVRHADEPFDTSFLLHTQYLMAARTGVGALMDGIDADTLLSDGDALVRQVRAGRWLAAWRNARGLQRIYRTPVWWSLTRATRAALVPNWLRKALHGRRLDARARNNVRLSLLAPDFAARIDLRERLRTHASWRSLDTPRDTVSQAVQALHHPNTTVGFERYHRTAAWHGIDPRHPFSDRAVMELCVNLPDGQRIANGWSKAVLRRAMQSRLPDAVNWRTGKEHLGAALIQRLVLDDPDDVRQRLAVSRNALAPYLDLNKLDQSLARAWQPRPGSAPSDVLEALHLGNWLQQHISRK